MCRIGIATLRRALVQDTGLAQIWGKSSQPLFIGVCQQGRALGARGSLLKPFDRFALILRAPAALQSQYSQLRHRPEIVLRGRLGQPENRFPVILNATLPPQEQVPHIGSARYASRARGFWNQVGAQREFLFDPPPSQKHQPETDPPPALACFSPLGHPPPRLPRIAPNRRS